MTDTPESGKEEFRAGKDEKPEWLPNPDDKQRMQEFFGDVPDIPDTYTHYDQETGSLTALSTQERIERWEAAQKKSLEKGTDARAEFTADLLERSRALKGPNPTQEKARTLYEWWRSGCGTYADGDYTPYPSTLVLDQYGNLDEGEKRRWAVLAKALGDHPYHDRKPGSVEERAERYKNIPANVSWAEYDSVLHPEDAGYAGKLDGVSANAYIHDDDPTYEEWVEAQPLQRKHWWQFWRPVEVHTEYDDYRLFIRNNRLRREAALIST